MVGAGVVDRSTARPREALFVAQGVDPEFRRMVVLRAAEVFAARRDAGTDAAKPRGDGPTPQETGAAVSEEPVARVAPDYELVCAVIDELSELGTLTCSTLGAMQGRFGDATIRTLALIVGWLASVSLMLDGRPAPARVDGGSPR